MDTLYDKYGGFDTFNMVVGNFYQKVLDSEELSPYFEKINMEKLISHQTHFISTALGGPESESYSKLNLKAVHAPYKIKEHHFYEVVELLEESLEEAGVEQEDITIIISIISELMDEIISRDESK